MSYVARILEFRDYPHTRVFAETCGAINGALKDLGMHDDGGRQILFGANMLQHRPDVTIPKDAIIYNLEASNGPWFTPKYIDLMCEHLVLDYDAQQVRWLQARGINARWCPVRYHKSLTRLLDYEMRYDRHLSKDLGAQMMVEVAIKKTVDVLFYGSATPRRIPILQDIERNSGLCCRWIGHHDDWGMRDYWIPRSKIVLNLHSYSDAPLEMVRISYLLANRAFVVSEGPQERSLVSGMIFADADRLADVCAYWAQDIFAAERDRIATVGFTTFAGMLQTTAIKECLHETAEAS